jgi:hypothetical protein
MMKAFLQSRGKLVRCVGGAGALVLFLVPLLVQADSRSLYELSYGFGDETRSSLETYSLNHALRPGFLSELPRAQELSFGVRSTRLPSALEPGLSEQSLETTGGFIHRFGDSGFGYGVDFGLGLYSSVWDSSNSWSETIFSGQPSFVVSDFSAGPTYEIGNVLSRVRIGVRYPVLGEGDSLGAFHGHRGDLARGAGYLSLDGRMRFSNQTEMSVSVFYDDHNAGNTFSWPDRGLNFRGGQSAGGTVVGVEMGLNF